VKRVAIALAVLGALATAAPAAAKTTYCSPTGDYCTSVAKVKGVRYFRLTTFSFSGRVRICVKDPTGARRCHGFRLENGGQMYSLNVLWKRHFPNRGRGTYRVSFFLGTTRLGPVLSFTQR
jgi:hypothetical protein